jgi:hypothetical protein
MKRFAMFVAPMMALVLAVAYSVRAEDKPAAATGTVTVTVTDKDGKAVDGASVRITAPRQAKNGAAAAAEPKLAEDAKTPPAKNAPVAQGTTDKEGKATLENVPVGEYNISANLKGTGNARQKITIEAGKTVNVELKLAMKSTGAPK